MNKLFILTPIDQTEGLEECRYIVKNDYGMFEVSFDNKYQFNEEFTDCSDLTHYLRPLPEGTVAVPHDLLMEIKGTLTAIAGVSNCNGSRQLANGLLTKLAQMGK